MPMTILTSSQSPCPCGCGLSVAECIENDNPLMPIIADAAFAWGLTADEVKKKCREAKYIPARQLAMAVSYAILKDKIGMSEMALVFGLKPEGRSSITLAWEIVSKATGRQGRLYAALTKKYCAAPNQPTKHP